MPCLKHYVRHDQRWKEACTCVWGGGGEGGCPFKSLYFNQYQCLCTWTQTVCIFFECSLYVVFHKNRIGNFFSFYYTWNLMDKLVNTKNDRKDSTTLPQNFSLMTQTLQKMTHYIKCLYVWYFPRVYDTITSMCKFKRNHLQGP